LFFNGSLENEKAMGLRAVGLLAIVQPTQLALVAWLVLLGHMSML